VIIHECNTRYPRMHAVGEISRQLIRGLADELSCHPQLWNVHKYRTEHAASPHREVDDIWVRFNAIENLDPSKPATFNDRHVSVWYPAADILTSVKAAIFAASKLIKATEIGGVLITRIPAGGQVYPHADGGWHAGHFNRKLVVIVRGNIEQSFCFRDEELQAEPGDVFEFDNSHVHWVTNPTAEERISLIITTRADKVK
jgi:aspartyl/asparaginyl beta-hydroxylase